jgi:IstB-like ATP binding protein
VIDEAGYLSYSNRHADLMFELISRRYEQTNRPFAEWRRSFQTPPAFVSLVDRLIHHAEILAIEGESYRLKEANERSPQRTSRRQTVKPPFLRPVCRAQHPSPSRPLGHPSRPWPWSNCSITSATGSGLNDVKLFDLIREQRLPRSAEQFDEPSF